MAVLPDHKRAIVQSVIAMAPDSALRSLEMALASDRSGNGMLSGVRALVEQEASDRKVRNEVLDPILPLCAPRGPGMLSFPPQTPAQIWRALKSLKPDMCKAAAMRVNWTKEEGPPAILDTLCGFAAGELKAKNPAFEALSPLVASEVAACLDLAPMVRVLSIKLEVWANHMTPDRAAAVRLSYKDASAMGEDYGPRFFEMLAGQLEQPWLILRLISAVMDRPTEKFLAASELSRFGDSMVVNIEGLVSEVARFDPSVAGRDGRGIGEHGEAAGRRAGRKVEKALMWLCEFEAAVQLAKDGRWGKAVFQQKQTLAKLVESRLAGLDKLIGAALPQDRPALPGRRGAPKPDVSPDPSAVLLAVGGLAFADSVRSAAANGGFGAARAKALEKVNERLNAYTDDLLNYLRDPHAPHRDTVRSSLETAAEMVALAQDDNAAQILRRRAAAA